MSEERALIESLEAPPTVSDDMELPLANPRVAAGLLAILWEVPRASASPLDRLRAIGIPAEECRNVLSQIAIILKPV